MMLLATTSTGLTNSASTSQSLFGATGRGWLIAATFALMVVAIVLACVVLSRKPRNRPRRHSKENPATGPGKERYFRARGSSKRPDLYDTRRPTLAETGGLPPIKDKPKRIIP